MPLKDPIARKEYQAKRYQEHKSEYAARNHAYYVANSDRYKSQARAWREANPEAAERVRRGQILRGYGVDQAWYDRMLESQGSLCAICRFPFKRTPHVDHNHTTGKARALLCAGCNVAIAALESELLPEYQRYLEKHA